MFFLSWGPVFFLVIGGPLVPLSLSLEEWSVEDLFVSLHFNFLPLRGGAYVKWEGNML